MLVKESSLLHTIVEFVSCFSGWMTIRTACGQNVIAQEVVDTSKRRTLRPTCDGCAGAG